MLYRLLFDRVLTRIDAETAHTRTIALLRRIQRIPGALTLISRILGRPHPSLAVTALGLAFPTPLGLAAGFDKDAEVAPALTAFGFGFVEVGTVTAHAQPGNPRPRMARLPADSALINRMGFNNHGAAAAAANLRRHMPATTPIGVNIGKTKVAEDAPADYAASARLLAPLCDYLVVNVSSPNTPGLRDLQAVDSLRPVLQAVLDACDDTTTARPPVLVKIAPDLADADVDAVTDLAIELGLDGLIAANTSIGREGLASPSAIVQEAGTGGLSGAPLRGRALALLRRLHGRAGDRLVLVSVGGVETADDVWDRLAAGATLVQAYTGMVYGGPGFAAGISRDLRRRMRAEGITRLADLIGSAAS